MSHRPWIAPIAALPLCWAASAEAAPPIEQHTCENGLTVLVAEDHAVPLVTVQIAVKNGSMTESPEYNGLSHLYEHMFFKANKALPNQEAYLRRARELGMSWNGTTNTERVNYFFTTTKDHLGDAMVFMRDAIVSPLFDQAELDKEKEVVVGEIDRNLSSPGYHLYHAVQERVWWKYPSYKNPLGYRKTVRGATTAKMKTIQERYYVPNNSVLVVTGDVTAKDIFAQADKLYVDWKKAEDPFIKNPLVKHPALKESEVVVVQQNVRTVSGEIVWHGPSTVGDSVDLTYAADVLGTAFDNPTSKFQKALVDSGACNAAGLSWYTQMNTGPITLSFSAAEDKAEACVKAIFAELPKFKEPGYVTDAEMKSAAHTLEIGQIQEREKPSAFASVLTFWWTSAGLDYYKGYIGNVKKVTHDGIAKFVDGFMLGKPFVFGLMESKEMVAKGLDNKKLCELAGVKYDPKKDKPTEDDAVAPKDDKKADKKADKKPADKKAAPAPTKKGGK